MRALIFVASSILALSACGDKSATDVDANVSGDLAAEEIFSNDTTVIDAATGDASNMAADVTYDVNASDTSADVRGDDTVARQAAGRRQPAQTEPSPETPGSEAPMETVTETNTL